MSTGVNITFSDDCTGDKDNAEPTSFEFEVDDEKTTESSPYPLNSEVLLRLTPAGKSPTLSTTIGAVSMYGTGLELEIKENIVFAKDDNGRLKNIPTGAVAWQWVGRAPALNPSFDSDKITLSAKVSGVLKCTYKTKYDLVKVYSTVSGEALIEATVGELYGYTTLQFGEEEEEESTALSDVIIVVKDACSGATIKGASVRVDGAGKGLTDDAGRTKAGKLKVGTHEIKVTMSGYVDTDKDSISNDSFTISKPDGGAQTISSVSSSGISAGTTPAITSHTQLINIGTSSHTLIDVHLSSTSNPHGVTAAQVGNGTAQWNADKIQGVTVNDTSKADGKVLGYVSASGDIEYITVAAGGGEGEINTASNVGTAGVGVFKQKSGVDLQFKKINAGSNKITITDDTGNSEVDIDVAEANFTIPNITQITTRSHTSLSDIGTNAHSAIDTHLTNTSNPHSTSDANLTTTDITTNNVSTSKHGFVKKLSGVSTEFLSGTGNFTTPAGGGGGASTALIETLQDNITLMELRLQILESLTRENLINAMGDEFGDQSGVDLALSSSIVYDATNKLYKPEGAA